MRRCKTCVETNSRPTSEFDKNGICLPCKSVSLTSKATIDWKLRAFQLKEIITWGKEHSTDGYDCIIGVSGGKDSTRQALFAREHGLNPLLVCCSYPPEQSTEIGRKNLANLVNLGFDLINVTPAPLTSKELMKNCFKTYGNLFNASELALYASLPITAIAYKIPLILLGENPSLSFGNAVGGSADYDGNKQKHMNTLKGGDPKKFMTENMSDKDVYWYRYPSDEDMEKAELRIVYLGYFMNDFDDHTNFKIATEHGLKTREGEDAKPENIGGITAYTALDDDFVFVNQMLKYMKFGFGKATQEVGVAIREGLMTRVEGIEKVKLYDGKCHEKYIKKLANYLEMSVGEFWEIAEQLRNKDLFYKDENDEWQLKDEHYV